jgi:hypothetical protein
MIGHGTPWHRFKQMMLRWHDATSVLDGGLRLRDYMQTVWL